MSLVSDISVPEADNIMIIGPFDSSGSLYYNYSQLPKEYHVASMECKHKRNGPCIISLNCCLGVRGKALFSAYAVVGIRSSKISLGDGVSTERTAFTEDMNTSISKNHTRNTEKK